MFDADFMTDKFVPAALPDVCAPRRALMDRLHEAAARRLVIVSAPAGYGKTVSTALWLHGSGRRAVWIGLDGYDNTLAIFYKLLGRGIASMQPENRNMARVLKSESFAPSPVEHVISLLAEFEPDGARYALVLDDMHLITNEEILRSLPFIFRRLPHAIVTLILSRNAPDQAFRALLEADKAASITHENLTFSADEIARFFTSLGRSASADEVATAHAITGGWAIGVNALAQGDALEAGPDSGRLLARYIKKQIWDKWDDPLRDFILKTSVADEISVALAQRLTGRADSGAVLHRLHAANAFISKIAEDTYRYHPLFDEFLRAARGAQLSTDESKLNKICAQYHAERSNPLLSLRYWLRSGDYKGIGPYFYSYFFDEHNRAMVENIAYFESFFRTSRRKPFANTRPCASPAYG